MEAASDNRGPAAVKKRRLLLDSHTFLWAVANPAQLGSAGRKAIEDARNTIHISAASLWELLLKASKGKLDLGLTPSQRLQSFLDRLQAEVLPVRFDHLVEAYSLPGLHREPFDRLLIGQARVEGLTLVTKDSTIAQYDLEVLW
jgi:PIN domain nuclease of toxin-antitoxin system